MEKKKNTPLIQEYHARINRVVDYIENNLEKSFSLDELADVACFSKYHFHRIFYSHFQETLFRFIQRIRVEKAANLLVNNPDSPITDIALDCGFSSSALFTRTFKEHFNSPPSKWRYDKTKQETAGLGQNFHLSKNHSLPDYQVDYVNNNQVWTVHCQQTARKVTITNLPQMTVAYIRNIGPYKGDADLFHHLWNQLMKWAVPRGLTSRSDSKYLIIYHDDLNITADNKLRTSVCISIPSDLEVKGEIGKMVFPGGRYAMARFALGPSEYAHAWNWVYADWLPLSGYQPDDGFCFELYPQEETNNKQTDKQIVDICVPVKEL